MNRAIEILRKEKIDLLQRIQDLHEEHMKLEERKKTIFKIQEQYTKDIGSINKTLQKLTDK